MENIKKDGHNYDCRREKYKEYVTESTKCLFYCDVQVFVIDIKFMKSHPYLYPE